MEGSADPEGDGPLRPASGREVERRGHRHALSADDDLLRRVDVGDVRPGLPADLLDGHLVEADDRRHASGALFARLLHQASSLLYEVGRLPDFENARDR